MGAMPFEYLAPWFPDPNVALREFQASFLAENYDLPQLIREQLQSSRDAVRACEEDGDEYGILNVYQADVEYLESIVDQPLPEQPQARIRILQKIFESGGEGMGNVLDIEGVTEDGGVFNARQLPETELEEILGTTRPTEKDVKKLLATIADQLGRGESVCCPVYKTGKPCGWWFAGYTVD